MANFYLRFLYTPRMSLPCLVGRMGGKSRLKKTIVEEYFPRDYESNIYVEPFVGGGSIYFHKKPSVVEVINDLDKTIYDIFSGAKTYNHEDIAKKLNGDYTKEEFNAIKQSKPDNDFDKFCRTYYLMKKSIMAIGSVWNRDRSKTTIKLKGYKERLANTEIYNTDYKELIKKYDSPNTFFYLDPPYEKSGGCYKHYRMDMNTMFDLLSNIQGKFLMSYNDSDTVRELFKDFCIYEIETKYVKGHNTNKAQEVVEIIISNYPCF